MSPFAIQHVTSAARVSLPPRRWVRRKEDMSGSRHLSSRRNRLSAVVVSAFFVLAGAAVGLVGAPAAAADQVVNVTLNIPADIRDVPCTPPDIVNLSGQLHLMIYTHADSQGGYHVTQESNEAGQGASIIGGARYVGSEDISDKWYVSAPYPSIYTTTHSLVLASSGSSPNFLMLYDVHTTVTANGVPTATVDNLRLKCTG